MSKVFLTKREETILEEMRYGKTVLLHLADVGNLLELGFISEYALGEKEKHSHWAEYVIRANGLRYFEYLEEARKIEKEAEKVRKSEACNKRIVTAIMIVTALLTLAQVIRK